MKPQLRAYFAGCMDCDGSFMILTKRPNQIVLRVSLGQTTPQIPELLKRYFGGDIQLLPRTPPRKLRYCWRLESRSAIKFCEAVLPFLELKQKQAALLLELGRTFTEPKYAMYSYWYGLSHPNWRQEELLTISEAQEVMGYASACSCREAIYKGVVLALGRPEFKGSGSIFHPRVPKGQAEWLGKIRAESKSGKLPPNPPPLLEWRLDLQRQVRKLNGYQYDS